MAIRNGLLGLLAGLMLAGGALASPVKVGLLLDIGGPYELIAGKGSVAAARMAIEDFGGTLLGEPIELLYAHHGNQAPQAVAIAERWLKHEGVGMIADVVGSPIALAVQELNRDIGAVLAFNAVVTTAVTNEACAPTGFHWMYDGYMFSRAAGRLAARRDRQRWFVVHVDNGYGRNTLENIRAAVAAHGGEITGSVAHPLGETRMLRFMLEAERAGAQVLAIASAGNDLLSILKQAYDLRSVSRGDMAVVPVAATVANVREAGLGVTQGMYLATPFYWGQSSESHAWAQRFRQRFGRMPSEPQAGVYSAMMHYFKAVAATGTQDGPTVAAKMRELPVVDPVIGRGVLRADGRLVHDVRIVRINSPLEAQDDWDVATVTKTIPGNDAFMPLSQSRCPLLR